VTYPPPKWKTLSEFPRYEISEEGQVRVRETGLVLKRLWRDGKPDASGKTTRGLSHLDSHGSLCVCLWNGGAYRKRRVWKLLERYWPEVEYPAHWKAVR